MPSMTVMRFCSDEEGRETVLPDYITPAAEVAKYPWPPPEDMAVLRLVTHWHHETISAGMVGRPDGLTDEAWASNLAQLTRNINEMSDDIGVPSLLIFRRHKVSEIDPLAEVPKGKRSTAAGALYVLERTIERTPKEQS